MSGKVTGKIQLYCIGFNHPNKPDNKCPGELIDVGGEVASSTNTRTRLRCNNNKCQRVIDITIAELASIIERLRQERYQKSTRD